MRKAEAEKAFPAVKRYVERKNGNLVVLTYEYCESRGGKLVPLTGICVGHRDGTLMASPEGGESHWFLYRSKADFSMMMLGCETPSAAAWRRSRHSPKIGPVASSLEELKLKLAVLLPDVRGIISA